MKRLDAGKNFFRTKTINFNPAIHLSWLAKIELSRPGPPGCQYPY